MSNIRTFKRIELEGCLFEKHKTELEKQKKDIMNYKEGFNKIERMNDNVSYHVLKEEMKAKKYKRKKMNEFVFKKNVYNIHNYKSVIKDEDDKANPDNQMIFNLFKKLEKKKYLKENKTKRKLCFSNDNANNVNINNSNTLLSHTLSSKLYSKTRTYFTYRNNNTVSSEHYLHTLQSNYEYNGRNIKSKYNVINNTSKDFNKRKLNKRLKKVLFLAQKENENIKEFSNELRRNIKTTLENTSIGYNSERTFYYKRKPSILQNINHTQKQNNDIVNIKYNNNSEYTYPIVNKIINTQYNGKDVFEKVKENVILKYKEDLTNTNSSFIKVKHYRHNSNYN